MPALVLTRRDSEGVEVWIDGRKLGRVFVARIQGAKVRLGFDFGDEVELWRDELVAAGEKISPSDSCIHHDAG